jgi:uncharacterized protein
MLTWRHVYLLIWLPLVALSSAQSVTLKPIVILSGREAGAYRKVANLLASNPDSSGFKFEVKDSPGSVDNIKKLLASDIDMRAFAQQDVALELTTGSKVKRIAYLFPELVHVVASGPIKSISDLQGKKIFIGEAGSGSEWDARKILLAYGVTEANPGLWETKSLSDFDPPKPTQPTQPASEAAVAAFYTGAAGVACSALQPTDLHLVPVDYDTVRKALPFVSKSSIEPKDCPGRISQRGVPTIAVKSALLVMEKTSPEDILKLTTRLFSVQLPETYRPYSPSDRRGQANDPIPLHPGARDYFDQKQIAPPASP